MQNIAETAINTMVPGGGFEPPTRGFSIQCYSIEIRGIACKPPVEAPRTKGDSVNRAQLHNAVYARTNRDSHTLETRRKE